MTRTVAALCVVGAGLGSLLGGCASDGAATAENASADAPPRAGDTTPADGASGDDLASILEQDVRDLESLRTSERTPSDSSYTRRPPPVVVDGDTPATSVDRPVSIASDDGSTPPIEEETAVAAEPEPTSEQWVHRLGAELATRLRERAERSGTPFEELARLAALGVAADGIGTSAGSASSRLSGMEQATLDAWREMLSHASAALSGSEGDTRALIEAVRDGAAEMEGLGGLRILRTQLCSRVEGYGRYTPLGDGPLVAGRRHRMIVYVELEGFSRTPAAGEDGAPGYRVRLTQELALYHAADGLLAWRQRAQEIDDFSRNLRRDFFVVQLIELPETLTVGSYRLKVTMEDAATGAQVEEIVPVDIVADESAGRRRSR